MPRKRTTKDAHNTSTEDSGQQKPKRGRRSKKDIEAETSLEESFDDNSGIKHTDSSDGDPINSKATVADTNKLEDSEPNTCMVDQKVEIIQENLSSQVFKDIEPDSPAKVDQLKLDIKAEMIETKQVEIKPKTIETKQSEIKAETIDLKQSKDELPVKMDTESVIKSEKIVDKKVTENVNISEKKDDKKVKENVSISEKIDDKKITENVSISEKINDKKVMEKGAFDNKKPIKMSTNGGSEKWQQENGNYGDEFSREDSQFPKLKRYISKYFKNYYIEQNILKSDEFDKFMDILYTPLPTTLRFIGSSSHIDEMNKVFQSQFVSKFKDQNLEEQMPKNLEWFPNSCIWQWQKPNVEIKENVPSPLLLDLAEFIRKQNKMGTTCQLDMISFLPAVLMKLESHHKVLDMSGNHVKSMQLLQLLNSLNANPLESKGFVVNCEGVIINCRGIEEFLLQMDSPNFTIINIDLSLTGPLKLNGEDLKYDRILTHLNSDNDGLFRCDISQMQSWDNGLSYRFHSNLFEQLKCGLSLLAVDGLLMYSIHSINPLEGEAVVASAITSQHGTVELVDIIQGLEMFEALPGLTDWKVIGKNGRVVERGYHNNYYKVPESMFPPMDPVNLEKCVRILPNKGIGIFMALIKRTKSFDEVYQKVKIEEEQKLKTKFEEEETRRMADKQKRDEARAKKKKVPTATLR